MVKYMFLRLQHFVDLGSESCFLWGPRQCGKSTLLKQKFPHSPYYDLLLSNEFERLNRRPSLLREELIAQRPTAPVIIDEVQKIPHLLDEIQWLMVNKKIQFVLCGSSARKLNHGCLPRHYVSRTPELLGRSYVGDYLKEEIAAEALTRNVPAFARFLEAAAFSNGEIMNFTNIARECGVSGPTVREYFQILEDTLIARFVSAFQKKPKRRVIRSPKFYLFDVG